jgi:hypothetical protein
MTAQSKSPQLIDRRSVLGGAAAFWFSGAFTTAYARQSDESRVTLVDFELLRPSQGAVGMREVASKTADLLDRARKPEKFARFLIKEAIPVVRGPGGGLHVIDHHHHGRALWEAKQFRVHVETMADLSKLDESAFWAEMDKRGWLHAYDGDGKFVGPKGLPRYLKDLGDDPYRSLSGVVRSAGGFRKTDVPFAEFKWADFFRPRISKSLVTKDFDSAVKQALLIAGSGEASKLPGYEGRLKKAG